MPTGQAEIIVPITITDAILTSSDVPENDKAAWAVGTAYTVGQEVMVTTPNIHKIYICRVNSTGHNPPDNIYDGTTDPVTGYWSLVSATNRWKMFDQQTGSKTSQTGTIEVSLTPGLLYNSVAFFGLECDELNVTVMRGAVEVYNTDVVMKDLYEIDGYFDWFFAAIEKKETVVLTDLPAYTDTVMTITADAGAATCKIGEMVVGKFARIGVCEHGTTIGILDFSRKETDADGFTTIEQRRFANTVDYGIVLQSNKVNRVKRLLAQYRATPIVYIGDEDLPETIVYGFFNDFSIVIENFNMSSCSLQVEELS